MKLCLDGAFRKPVYVSSDWQQAYLSHFQLTGFVSGSNCSEPIYAPLIFMLFVDYSDSKGSLGNSILHRCHVHFDFSYFSDVD